jgi:hypothetical protein
MHNLTLATKTMENKIVLEKLTQENVLELSEEDVSGLLIKTIIDLPKDKRSYYVKIINTAFEFRSISSKNRNLKGDLTIFGYKFFPIPNNKSLIMGIKRKSVRSN